MAKKTWNACAQERREHPGEYVCVTRPDPATALNPERLEYLKREAEKVGLATDIRPLVAGKRPLGLFVAWEGR
jgi:hypothetical protein